MESVFSLENVKTKVLHSISLEIPAGEITAIIGPSGAGKSSMLKLLNRLEDPVQGQIKFWDKPIQSYPILELRRKVGIVFQSPALFPGTVEENIMYGPSLHKPPKQVNPAALLDQVQLPTSFLKRRTDQLSGGEQQRVAFARSLANEPEVLLLDEPTSALDAVTIEAIEDVLLDLQKSRKKTIIMVTHDLKQAQRLSTTTVFLKAGEIVEAGYSSTLLYTPDSLQLSAYLKGEK